MLLYKDGITLDITEAIDIARLKRLGYQEVVITPPDAKADETNTDAIKDANKPIGSRKAKELK